MGHELLTEARPGTPDGSHGSVERLPGDFFRAMATLFLKQHPQWSRGALARELSRRLDESGVHFHQRTLKRQLAGTIETVPPELETSLQSILLGANGYRTSQDIQQALTRAHLEVPAEQHAPAYLAVERILPLAQLWLHLNPGVSKRALACRLRDDLAKRRVPVNVDSLQGTLAGKKRLVRPEVREQLLRYLEGQGIHSEDEARARWASIQAEVKQSLDLRGFVDAGRFRRLCLVWRMHRREASSRALAVKLKAALEATDRRVGLHHLQNLVNGRTRRVRRAILHLLEEMIRREVPEIQDLDAELAKEEIDVRRAADLCWVKADPIVAMARAYLAAHPECSTRQLALQMAKTIRRMGYATSPNTLQPILGGWKLKTRGYVYRALLKHVNPRSRAKIPDEHLLSPLPKPEDTPSVVANANPEEVAVAKLSMAIRSRRSKRMPSVDQFLRSARRHLDEARSVNFLEFQAYRAAKLYGISREEAREQLMGGKRGRRWMAEEGMSEEVNWPGEDE